MSIESTFTIFNFNGRTSISLIYYSTYVPISQSRNLREHIIMKVQENRVVEYKRGADFVIFSYNCGIVY